jgi:hypothetical protein
MASSNSSNSSNSEKKKKEKKRITTEIATPDTTPAVATHPRCR